MKMLSRRRIESVPTYYQYVSEAKNSGGPTTLTPRPRCHILNGEL